MTILDDFIADARKVPLETVFELVEGQLGRKRANEYVGPCPACGGRDRFSINIKDQVWFCRQYDGKGGDGLALMAHRHGLDLKRRAEFLLACSFAQGNRPIPESGERETEEERAAREKRNEDRRAKDTARRRKNDDTAERERAKARSQGRGIYLAGVDGADTAAEAYLKLRTGADPLPAALWENLRFHPSLTYWHDRDERGFNREIHCGPALVAPMVNLSREIVGSHQTWIDLGRAPKFRPLLTDDDGNVLPTKKMRGHKRASLIPVFGDIDATRWTVGEGIENVLAVAAFEGFRADTFYFAAGDLGNMAGPAAKMVAHSTLKKQDSKGRWKPVMIPGPGPRPGCEEDCFQLLAHVRALTLLADGDSEPEFTVAAMARAASRLARDDLMIKIEWPPAGYGDFSEFFSDLKTKPAA